VTPVTDIASVGAMTPIETEAVSGKRSSRRSAGRVTGLLTTLATVISGQGGAQGDPGAMQQDPLVGR
jgi:hypothetical protein